MTPFPLCDAHPGAMFNNAGAQFGGSAVQCAWIAAAGTLELGWPHGGQWLAACRRAEADVLGPCTIQQVN